MAKVHEEIFRIVSPWVRVIGERLEDDAGRDVTYWRVEKPDSLIVLPLCRGAFVLPRQEHRHGIGEHTWDFPGGRVRDDLSEEENAYGVLERELGVTRSMVLEMERMHPYGLAINSAFSNQRLIGFIAQIEEPPRGMTGLREPATPKGVHRLLEHLTCLQCRALLLEWAFRSGICNSAGGQG